MAAIVLGTFVDLIETLKFVNSRPSISSTNSTAAATSASTGLSRSSSCRCFGSEPELTPIRIGIPAAFARSATSATFSRPPMFPGLSRMQWAPASIAFSASVWLKWMSAITGIGDWATIVRSAAASSSRGTATRTRSAPASATLRICSIVASRFAVSVFVIVWTATGAPPPIGTPPTNIWRFDAMRKGYPGASQSVGLPRQRRRILETYGCAAGRAAGDPPLESGGEVCLLLVGPRWSLLASAVPAQATFHLMSIREVYPGSAAAPESSYVELQMYAAGQEMVEHPWGHAVQRCRNGDRHRHLHLEASLPARSTSRRS